MFASGSGKVDLAQLILVESDILIDAGGKVTVAIDHLEHMVRQDIPGASVMTLMGRTVGCRNKRELYILEQFLRRRFRNA